MKYDKKFILNEYILPKDNILNGRLRDACPCQIDRIEALQNVKSEKEEPICMANVAKPNSWKKSHRNCLGVSGLDSGHRVPMTRLSCSANICPDFRCEYFALDSEENRCFW